MYWGYHLVLNVRDCLPKTIRSEENIKNFAAHLVKQIDMVAFGDAIVVHFGSDNKAGYTLVQLIETSNICAHFVEETNDIYLDVFSCKPFESETVVAVVNEYFSPKSTKGQFLYRQA